MKKIFFIMLLLVISEMAFGQIPKTISYQGVLKDASDIIVPDGNCPLTFKIYDQANGGVALWTEDDTVSVRGGILNVILGNNNPLNLAFDKPYWLGVTLRGYPELAPRVELTTVPYSFKAQKADTALVALSSPANGDSCLWGTDGTNVYRLEGRVGVGDTIPGARIHVYSNTDEEGATGGILVDQEGTGDAGITFRLKGVKAYGMGIDNSDDDKFKISAGSNFGTGDRLIIDSSGRVGVGDAIPGARIHVYSNTDEEGATGGILVDQDDIGDSGLAFRLKGVKQYLMGIDNSDNDKFKISDGSNFGLNDRIIVDTAGNVGVGTTGPGEKLDVDGTVQMTGFKMPTGAADGYVLTSDGSGGGTWQPACGWVYDNEVQVFSGTGSMSYTDLNLSGVIGSNRALVMLKVQSHGDQVDVSCRTNGETSAVGRDDRTAYGAGISGGTAGGGGNIIYLMVITDASGIIEHRVSIAALSYSIYLVAHQKL